MFGEYGRWIWTSQPSCDSFYLVIKETSTHKVSWWKTTYFLLTNSKHFLQTATFRWSNLEQYLDWIIWLSARSSLQKDWTSLQSHHIYNITFSEWRSALGVVCGGSFHLPHDLFHFTLLCRIYFSSPLTSCFKNRMLSLCFSRESHVDI